MVGLIALAFDFSGAIEPEWLIALVAATLPASLVAWLGAYSLIHGASLELFAVFFLACAVFNIWLVRLIVRKLR